MVNMTCCTRIVNHFRARVVQCRARAHYRVDRWRMSRIRRKWVKRENEYRKEMEIILTASNFNGLGDKGYSRVSVKPDPLLPVWGSEKIKDPQPKPGVSVLSPQRLSERLSENALAREAVGESDLELAQYLKDERIALFLQNDEFITELRSNQDFMSALQREHDGDSEVEEDYDQTQTYRSRRSRGGDGGGGVIPPLDDATFKERLATMGKASRKKFAQIAKVFSRGKRGTAARSLLPNVGGSTSANGKDLLMSSDPLIDDYEDERIQSSSDPILSTSPRHNP